jgi:NAD+ kinase
MIIALFPNPTKPQAKSLAIGIREFLTKEGITVVADDKEAKGLGTLQLSACKPEEIDYSICIGGDGTILRYIHHFNHLLCPVIGVNIGTLGFLADIPAQDVYPALADILNGKLQIQERIMIELETAAGVKCLALNEIAIHRTKNPCLIDLAVHVDGTYLNTFSADGIIVATPSGSTAYSLSAGGPILTPELSALVITPICPHTISNVPLVIMPKNEIQIQYLSHHEPVEIISDGISVSAMKEQQVLHIRIADRTLKLANLSCCDYFATLREKLNWSGTLKL